MLEDLLQHFRLSVSVYSKQLCLVLTLLTRCWVIKWREITELEVDASLVSFLYSVTITNCNRMVWTECLCPPPPKFMRWNSNTQCGVLWRWGLCQVIRVRRGHEGGPLVMELAPNNERKRPELPFSALWGYNDKTAVYKPVREPLSRTEPTSTLILNFHPPELQNYKK